MSREKRALMARETVAICEAGFYTLASGKRVEIAADLSRAKAGTVLYSPEKLLNSMKQETGLATRFEVRNETTFQALSRLNGSGGHVACLNFASAKNPGGGFLNGSLAQEEALACASGLHPCLLTAPEYYERNRGNRSTLYLDLIIFSPLVPFIRNDAGALLEKPILSSMITAPAPNAGAIAQNEPANLRHVESTLRRRTELVLRAAVAHGVEHLVLGAWGCGVFRNDPRVVAGIFAEFLLKTGAFANAFTSVTFAVLDRTIEQETHRAFAKTFGVGVS